MPACLYTLYGEVTRWILYHTPAVWQFDKGTQIMFPDGALKRQILGAWYQRGIDKMVVEGYNARRLTCGARHGVLPNTVAQAHL
jgi:hypothetical protein